MLYITVALLSLFQVGLFVDFFVRLFTSVKFSLVGHCILKVTHFTVANITPDVPSITHTHYLSMLVCAKWQDSLVVGVSKPQCFLSSWHPGAKCHNHYLLYDDNKKKSLLNLLWIKASSTQRD